MHARIIVSLFFALLLLFVGCTLTNPVEVPAQEASEATPTPNLINPVPTQPSTPTHGTVINGLTPASTTPEPLATLALPTFTPVVTLPVPGEVILELVGQIGGAASLLAVEDSTAYLSNGYRLVVVDVSDSRNPQLLGQSGILPDLVRSFILSNSYVYLTSGSGGLAVLDVSDLAKPQIVGAFDTPGDASGLLVVNNYAYIADGNAGLQVVDVSDPTMISYVGTVDIPGLATVLNLTGENYIYLISTDTNSQTGGLRVLDITNRAIPDLIGSLDISHLSSSAVAGDYVYLTTYDATVNTAGLVVIEVFDPTSPRQVAYLELPNFLTNSNVTVSESYAYVTGGYCDLGTCSETQVVIDVTDPETPHLIEDASLQTSATGREGIRRNNLLFTTRNGRLEIWDFTNPASPSLLGQLDLIGSIDNLAIAERNAYIVDDKRTFYSINISDAAVPLRLGSLAIPQYCQDCASQVNDLEAANGFAYLGLWNDGLVIVDVREPSQPQVASHLDISGDLHDIAVSDDYIFIVNWLDKASLHIINVADSAQPYSDAKLQLEGLGYWRIAATSTHVYVMNGGCGEDGCHGKLRVFDASNPTMPRKVSEIDVPGAVDIAVAEGYAYVATELCYYTYTSCSAELWTIDVTDPSQPQQVGVLTSENELPRHIVVANGIAYWGRSIVDITEPSQLRVVGVSDYLSGERQATGIQIYVAGEGKGLLLMEASDR